MGSTTYTYTSNEGIKLALFIGGYIDFFNTSSVNYCQVNNQTLFSTWSA